MPVLNVKPVNECVSSIFCQELYSCLHSNKVILAAINWFSKQLVLSRHILLFQGKEIDNVSVNERF